MRVTARGWTVAFLTSFAFGALFPWDSMPWNQL